MIKNNRVEMFAVAAHTFADNEKLPFVLKVKAGQNWFFAPSFQAAKDMARSFRNANHGYASNSFSILKCSVNISDLIYAYGAYIYNEPVLLDYSLLDDIIVVEIERFKE